MEGRQTANEILLVASFNRSWPPPRRSRGIDDELHAEVAVAEPGADEEVVPPGERDAVGAGRVGPRPWRRRAAVVPVLVHGHHVVDPGDVPEHCSHTHTQSMDWPFSAPSSRPNAALRTGAEHALQNVLVLLETYRECLRRGSACRWASWGC